MTDEARAGDGVAVDKRGETSNPPEPQPEAAEVESARVLANQARERLLSRGLSEEEIRALADEFIALGLGTGLAAFVPWAVERSGQGARGR